MKTGIKEVHENLLVTFCFTKTTFFFISEHMYAEIRASSPSPPPLPPPLITDELIYYEEKTMTEGNYQSNINIPSHLKWPSKRVIRAAELAYLYERHSDEFELPFYPKRAGVTDVVDSLYDDPTCLSLTPAPGILRVQDSNQNAIQGCDGEAETKLSLSYPNRTHQETALL